MRLYDLFFYVCAIGFQGHSYSGKPSLYFGSLGVTCSIWLCIMIALFNFGIDFHSDLLDILCLLIIYLPILWYYKAKKRGIKIFVKYKRIGPGYTILLFILLLPVFCGLLPIAIEYLIKFLFYK